MQNGRFLSLMLAVTIIVACAPNQALTDTKPAASPYAPVLRLEEFDVAEVRIRIEWSDYLKCEGRVLYRTPESKEFKEAEKVQVFTYTETDKKPSKLIGCGTVDGNQRCETCRFITVGSPTYTTIKIGDRTYKVCICDCPGTPKCR